MNLPLATPCAHSISRRLSWLVAVQAFVGLLVLSGIKWAVTSHEFDKKHAEQWDVKASITQEIVRNTAKFGEAMVVEKMRQYAERRPDTFVVLYRADGSELYRDASASFDVNGKAVRNGRFEVPTPGMAGGTVRGTMALDCDQDRVMLGSIAAGIVAAALAVGGLMGWLAFRTVRRGLAPLDELARQTRAIDARRLGQRLKLSQPVQELQPAVDQFNALMERLERAYVQLESFNADVAHELRTPLAAVIGHTELALSRERTPEALRETLSGNLEELQRLSAMVNDMLFLASADRGAQARRGQPVSLAALARQVLEFHEASLEDAALQVRIDGDATVPVDEPLVKRALSNLIGNATRYAPHGSELAVRIEPPQSAPGDGVPEVRVVVENQGPPIAPEALPRIFDRFFRADTARCSAEGAHHGLGLAIVAAIARMHRGRPWAESGAGGTRVGFSLAAV